jgi:hypothetical protein
MSFEDDLAEVRRRQDAAMEAQAAQGSTREGVFLAGVRAALDHAVANLEPAHAQLERVLGQKVDRGAFFIGALGAMLALQDVDLLQVAERYGPLLNAYIEEARFG